MVLGFEGLRRTEQVASDGVEHDIFSSVLTVGNK